MSVHATSTEVYSGKNLINASSSFTVTNSNVYRSIPVSISNGTTVCVQCDSITTNSTTGCSVRFQDANLAGVGTVILYPGTTLSQSVTLIGDAAYCYVYSSNNYASSQSATTTYTNLMVSTGSTAQPYEPYVGGVPSPLISGVTHVSTSKNLLNMQSNSNGEYFGTMSQHGITWKNLYIGSPSFSGYANISGWEDGGTYNGMPVIKKAGSWGGAYMLVNIAAGKTYTFSAWIKSDQARSVAFYAKGGSTGATADISPLSESITTSTNWERVSFTFTCTTSGSVGMRIENTSSSTTNYTYISGYQLEVGQEATSYEPYLGSGVYSGKNLMVYPYAARTPLHNGITFTSNADGTVVLNGQNNNTGNSAFYLYGSTPGAFTLPAGTYYFLRPSNTAVQFVAYDGTNYWGFNAENNYSKTFNSSITFQDVYIQVPRGNTTVFNNLKVYPMLSTLPNQTQDDYEPYVGGVPSPNPDYPQEIVTGELASKNLCPDITEGYYVTSTSTSWGKTAVDSGVLISVEPNTNYTISTTATQSRYRFCFVASLDDSNGYNGGANDGGSNTYTKNSGSYPYLIVNATDLSKIQVEKGSRATTFEPYFTPIELAKIGSYQDTVYKSGNTWYLHKEINNIKLSSDTGFILYTGVSDAGFTFFRATVTTSKDRQCMSNYFDTSLEGWDNLQNVHVEMAQVYTNNFLYLKTKTSRIASTSDLETWLSNRDVHVYYILATSTDTAITDQTTINWLNNNDTDGAPHHKYINTRRTTYVGASGLASAIDLYDGSYASTLPTYTTANDHHLTTANGGTYTVSLQNISASIISGTVTFSVFTNQRKIDFSWNGSATSTSVSISLQANEYIKSIYAYIPQDADAGITLSQQLESGSLTDFEPYYNIVKIYAGDDLVFEDTSLTD